MFDLQQIQRWLILPCSKDVWGWMQRMAKKKKRWKREASSENKAPTTTTWLHCCYFPSFWRSHRKSETATLANPIWPWWGGLQLPGTMRTSHVNGVLLSENRACIRGTACWYLINRRGHEEEEAGRQQHLHLDWWSEMLHLQAIFHLLRSLLWYCHCLD